MKILKRATIVFVLFFAMCGNLTINNANAEEFVENIESSYTIPNTETEEEHDIFYDFAQALADAEYIIVPGNKYNATYTITNDSNFAYELPSNGIIGFFSNIAPVNTCSADGVMEVQNSMKYSINPVNENVIDYKGIGSMEIISNKNENRNLVVQTPVTTDSIKINPKESKVFKIFFYFDFDANNCSNGMKYGQTIIFPLFKTTIDINYTSAKADGEKDKITSSKIDLTLSNDIGDLTTDNLTISNDKVKVEKITNNGDGKYTLDISGEWDQDDKVDIKVSKDGYTIDPDTQSTTLNKEKPHDNPDPGPGPNPNPTPDPDPTPDPKPNPKPTPTDKTEGVNKKKKQDKVDNVKKTNNDNTDHDLPRSGIEDLMVTYYFVIAGIVLATYSLYKRKYEA